MYKTLKELGVKVGDVVEFNKVSGISYIIVAEYRLKNNINNNTFDYAQKYWDSESSFTIVSRANRTWGEMTDSEKGLLLLAHHEGKVIQNKMPRDEQWYEGDPIFAGAFIYRIKPEPLVETVEIPSDFDEIVSVQVIDGVVQPDTIKMS